MKQKENIGNMYVLTMLAASEITYSQIRYYIWIWTYFATIKQYVLYTCLYTTLTYCFSHRFWMQHKRYETETKT